MKSGGGNLKFRRDGEDGCRESNRQLPVDCDDLSKAAPMLSLDDFDRIADLQNIASPVRVSIKHSFPLSIADNKTGLVALGAVSLRRQCDDMAPLGV